MNAPLVDSRVAHSFCSFVGERPRWGKTDIALATFGRTRCQNVDPGLINPGAKNRVVFPSNIDVPPPNKLGMILIPRKKGHPRNRLDSDPPKKAQGHAPSKLGLIHPGFSPHEVGPSLNPRQGRQGTPRRMDFSRPTW